jgi:nitrate/nitrite transport system substrate-binding protein
VSGRNHNELRIGFVPLLDAAPIIAAYELGYFSDEGLSVSLDRQIGWGNVRDKLTFGHLQASHALLGMPAASVMGWPRYLEPLVGLVSLGFGGNAIAVSKRLSDAGVNNATTLGEWIRQLPRGEARPVLAHTFDSSTHHYLLRDWLAMGEVNPDRDVRLCVLPPPQMVGQLCKGYLDGFCVGEPWSTAAQSAGCGTIVTVTTDLVPEHPEKLLAVTRKWLNENPEIAQRVVRAMLRVGEFCEDVGNRVRLTEILAQPNYLDVEPETLLQSFVTGDGAGSMRNRGQRKISRAYGVSAAGMFPSGMHVAWLLSQMKRWGHLPANADVRSIAEESIDSTAYRAVAGTMGVVCPANDFPPMRLREGWFSVESAEKQTGDLLAAK